MLPLVVLINIYYTLPTLFILCALHVHRHNLIATEPVTQFGRYFQGS